MMNLICCFLPITIYNFDISEKKQTLYIMPDKNKSFICFLILPTDMKNVSS